MVDYTAVLEAARHEGLRATPVLHIATATPIRMWGGVGNFETTADDELDPEEIYSGDGSWLSAPAMRTMLNGTADAGQLVFAATPLTRALLLDAGAGIIGARAYMGRVYLGKDWQPLAPVAWTWALIAGQPSVTCQGTNRTISLNVVSEFVDRSRTGTRYWTDAGHRARHPGDDLLSLRKRYNGVYRPKWN